MSDASDYLRVRRETLLSRRARMGEAGFAALCVARTDLLLRVPAGWFRLVETLHFRLILCDPNHLLYDVYERDGRLVYQARFTPDARDSAHELVAAAVRESTTICVICRAPGRLRERRPPRTLCAECHDADRAAMNERGERYANLALLYFMSCDPDHPTGAELEAWLDEAGRGSL